MEAGTITAASIDKTEDQIAITEMVRQFVDEDDRLATGMAIAEFEVGP